MQDQISTKKLVDGYKRAFIDSSIEADHAYSPQFVSNSGFLPLIICCSVPHI